MAQADMLLGPLLAMQPEMPELLKALDELVSPDGAWAELMSLQQEPLWRPEIYTSAWLRAEMLGRLSSLRGITEGVVASDEIVAAATAAGLDAGNPWAAISPGPLECTALLDSGMESIPSLPEAVAAAVEAVGELAPASGNWRLLDMASRHGRLGIDHLARLAKIACTWRPIGATPAERWLPMLHLARVAASQRHEGIAEAVLQAVTTAPEASEDVNVVLQVALVASAAWSKRSEAVKRFGDAALVVAWRALPSECEDIEAVIRTISCRLPVGDAWRLALVRNVAELGSKSRVT